MKRIMNKKYILGLITGIIVSGVTVYAVSTAATDITFKAKNDVIKMWSKDQKVGWCWSKPAICTIQYTKTTNKSNN